MSRNEQVNKAGLSVKFGMLESSDMEVKQILHLISEDFVKFDHLTNVDSTASSLSSLVDHAKDGEDYDITPKGVEDFKEFIENSRRLWFYMYYLLDR